MEGVQAAMTTRNLEPNQWRNRDEWHLVSGRRRQLFKKSGQTDFFMPDDGPCEGPKHVALLIQTIQNFYVQ
jgi:hypothetical protein